jgi:hypothetical protein
VKLLRLAWDRWQIIGHVNGNYIGRFAATAFYYTIFVPFAIGAKALTDPLKLKRPHTWLDRKPLSHTLDDARKQG